jgi:cell division transport system ATP-binding protein
MIYFDNVTKIYDDETVALSNINLKIAPHEFVSIVGHSGAGKSTLLKLILAEELPSEGSVFFESEDIHMMHPSDITQLRQKIGSIFQDFRLIPNKTVYENIAFAMEVAGQSDEEISQDVPYVLQLVDLERKALNFPSQLSGGEKQRVAIARALVNQPTVLIADEPTGNLDPANTYDIVQILKKINDLGTTIVLTTHNKGIIDDLQKRVITLENGKIVNDDPTGRHSFNN